MINYFKSSSLTTFVDLDEARVANRKEFELEGDEHPRLVFYSEPSAVDMKSVRDRLAEFPDDRGADAMVACTIRRIALQLWRVEGDWSLYVSRAKTGEQPPPCGDINADGELERREAFFGLMPETHLLAIFKTLEGTEAIDEDAKKK